MKLEGKYVTFSSLILDVFSTALLALNVELCFVFCSWQRQFFLPCIIESARLSHPRMRSLNIRLAARPLAGLRTGVMEAALRAHSFYAIAIGT